jgi:hypothetical protein
VCLGEGGKNSWDGGSFLFLIETVAAWNASSWVAAALTGHGAGPWSRAAHVVRMRCQHLSCPKQPAALHRAPPAATACHP